MTQNVIFRDTEKGERNKYIMGKRELLTPLPQLLTEPHTRNGGGGNVGIFPFNFITNRVEQPEQSINFSLNKKNYLICDTTAIKHPTCQC